MSLRRAAARCLPALAFASCRIERLRSADTGAAAADTTPVLETAASAAAAAVAVDTGPTIPAPGAPTRSDTTAASPDELTALAARMVVPVQGVLPGELHDAYDEPRGGRVHEALDIRAARGTPVVSATDGRLLKLHESAAGGLMIYAADAGERFILLYGHLERYADGLVEGMPLKRGQTIGYVGTSGNAPPDTPHLHFAVLRGEPRVAWWRGTPVNPYPLLAR